MFEKTNFDILILDRIEYADIRKTKLIEITVNSFSYPILLDIDIQHSVEIENIAFTYLFININLSTFFQLVFPLTLDVKIHAYYFI